MKDFNTWNKRKIKIDSLDKFQHPKAGEIWWCSIGVNVGTEIYGKGHDYTRPVLVINSEGSENFIGIPISSKIKNKKYSCIIKTDDQKLHTVLVYQIRSFDKRRLVNIKYILSKEEYFKIKKYFDKLYKIL